MYSKCHSNRFGDFNSPIGVFRVVIYSVISSQFSGLSTFQAAREQHLS